MKKNSWKFRVWVWLGMRWLKIPYRINFTPPDSEYFVGMGFAANQPTAERLAGNVETHLKIDNPNRATRKALNRAAAKAARKMAKDLTNK
jgi:hypothetical protein